MRINEYEKRRKEIQSRKRFDDAMKAQAEALERMFPFIVVGAVVFMAGLFIWMKHLGL